MRADRLPTQGRAQAEQLQLTGQAFGIAVFPVQDRDVPAGEVRRVFHDTTLSFGDC